MILEEGIPVAILAGSEPEEYVERLKKEQIKVSSAPYKSMLPLLRKRNRRGSMLSCCGF